MKDELKKVSEALVKTTELLEAGNNAEALEKFKETATLLKEAEAAADVADTAADAEPTPDDLEKTAETMTDDGYLRTGDKGEIDSEGFVKITGRLKEIFKTSKGKYVVPAPIEAKIVENTNVEQVCVTGGDLPQPVALMVLSEEASHLDRAALRASLEATLIAVNATLESHMRLDNFIIIDEEWTIENGLLTPTLKVKRHVLEERFKDVIQAAHQEKVTFYS